MSLSKNYSDANANAPKASIVDAINTVNGANAKGSIADVISEIGAPSGGSDIQIVEVKRLRSDIENPEFGDIRVIKMADADISKPILFYEETYRSSEYEGTVTVTHNIVWYYPGPVTFPDDTNIGVQLLLYYFSSGSLRVLTFDKYTPGTETYQQLVLEFGEEVISQHDHFAVISVG